MPPIFQHDRMESEQEKVFEVIEGQGPLTYNELEKALDGKDVQDIQSAIRGLTDNNLISTYLNESGRRVFSVSERIIRD